MKFKTYKRRSILMIMLAVTTVSALGAEGGIDRYSSSTAKSSALIYNSLAVNFGLNGYVSALAPVPVVNPTMSYQSLAYGPAIHSYPQVGESPGSAWNLTYVSPAYGQSIYSYPAVGDEPDSWGKLPSIIIE